MPFDIKLCVSYVEELLRQEELERALLVLDNVPATERMLPPKELVELRRLILKRSETTREIIDSVNDEVHCVEKSIALMYGLLRGGLLLQDVQQMNGAGKIPHIIDYGPGCYFVPIALRALDCAFTYWDLSVNLKAQAIARPQIPELKAEADASRPVIYVALEVIEHLHEPRDLAIEAAKHCGVNGPDLIHLSTPMCTYAEIPREIPWHERTLHHLRAYTPQEFLVAADNLFPGYHWGVHVPSHLHTQPMSIVGRKVKNESEST